MGFFEGAQNFEIHGGNFIDIRGGHIQYNTNMMSIRGNNNTAAMNPIFNPGGPPAPPHDPSYGPTQSKTSTYPGYAQSGSSHTNSSYTHSSHPNPPPNTTMYPAAGQQNVYYHYQTSQYMQAQYQPGQHPHPYPPGPGQQSYQQPGQQPYHHPSQPGQQPYSQPSQPDPRLFSSPPQPDHESYNYNPQQQSTTRIHQYQQVFHDSRVGGQRYRSASPSSTDSEDSDVTEIRENFERQDIS